jgi:hypothetical protein
MCIENFVASQFRIEVAVGSSLKGDSNMSDNQVLPRVDESTTNIFMEANEDDLSDVSPWLKKNPNGKSLHLCNHSRTY